ncbi:hypothetical protein LK996_12035 [Lysobacter sp. A6]|uniref:Rho-binding antiterminator n=1 Tax=Noviluteimonas lactosilytica TaxID=2888523 RepID=A0ABS8JJR9_9GAMM|nr:hypothetical protein [Lysobacter lactosilyticus]MCC8363802.1 hypothetical protein [Lysobacter lactosilyticus]
MSSQPPSYSPINCEFHDVLETRATTRALTSVVFRNEAGEVERRSAVISDVFARNGEEFLVLDSGDTVRLDRLLQIDDEKLADY